MKEEVLVSIRGKAFRSGDRQSEVMGGDADGFFRREARTDLTFIDHGELGDARMQKSSRE